MKTGRGLVLVLVLFLFSCASEEEKGQVIGPAGGSLASADGKLKVTVPAGALDTEITVTIKAATSPPAGAVGQVYEVGPSGVNFKKPVTVTMSYRDADLGRKPAAVLIVATFASSKWEPMDDIVVDQTAKTVSGTTTHFCPIGMLLGDGSELVGTLDIDIKFKPTDSDNALDCSQANVTTVRLQFFDQALDNLLRHEITRPCVANERYLRDLYFGPYNIKVQGLNGQQTICYETNHFYNVEAGITAQVTLVSAQHPNGAVRGCVYPSVGPITPDASVPPDTRAPDSARQPDAWQKPDFAQTPDLPACKALGVSCKSSSQCCSGYCNPILPGRGVCDTPTVTPDARPPDTYSKPDSKLTPDTQPAPDGPSCKAVGDSCTSSGECCSKFCYPVVPGYPVCTWPV